MLPWFKTHLRQGFRIENLFAPEMMEIQTMKTLTAVTLGLALLGSASAALAADNNPAAAAAGTYKNDPLHTSVTAKISHGGGLSNFTFRFTKTDITYTYDPAKPDATQVTAVIGAASVATDYERNATNNRQVLLVGSKFGRVEHPPPGRREVGRRSDGRRAHR